MEETLQPSRALDAALHRRFKGPVLSLNSGYFMDGGIDVPSYSSSLDAAASLCEALLPGWSWQITSSSASTKVSLIPDYDDPLVGEALKSSIPDSTDPLSEDGCGLVLSMSPPGRPALCLVGCLLSVLEGIEANRPPHHDFRDLDAFIGSLEAVSRRSIPA